jgi:O-antigen ligase
MSGAPLVQGEKPTHLALAVMGTLALASLNTKIAGLAWLLYLVWAGRTWQIREAPSSDIRRTALQAGAGLWLTGLLVYAGTDLAMTWGWHGACCHYTNEVNSHLRLVLSALATVVLVHQLRPWADMRHHVNLAVGTALAAGAVLAAFSERDLPSHPIPWAGAMALLVCVLMPQAWDVTHPAGRRWIYAAGSAIGLVGIVLSQSRGAFVVLVFPVLLLALFALRAHRRALAWAAAACTVSLALLTGWALAPSDPLRLRLAVSETHQALQSGDFSSSLGARVYLSRLAWTHFREAPWTGVGAAERIGLIKNAGLTSPPEEAEGLSHVRSLGHVHNQYWHHALDNGAIGLMGFLGLLASMVWVSLRLRAVDPVAALQMGFITLTHSTVSLSNVNLAHNYYALILGLCTAFVFVQALSSCTPGRGQV